MSNIMEDKLDRDGLKIGELVRLKSSGPVMTISWLNSDKRTIKCMWFSPMSMELKEEDFHIDTLEYYKTKQNDNKQVL